MSVLASFPEIPSASVLISLRLSYGRTLGNHVYLGDTSLPFLKAKTALPPYLNLAFACIGSCLQPIDPSFSTTSDVVPPLDPSLTMQLFHASSKVFTVMVETDNREARTVELILSVCVLRSPFCS